jgi:zinc transporter 1/2/3
MLLFSIDKFIDTHQHQPLSASNGTPNKNNELQMEIVNQISKNDQNLTNIPDKGAIPQIVLLFALSIHAMFEGLAIGVAETVSSCWQLILAVSCHKWAEALAMVLI